MMKIIVNCGPAEQYIGPCLASIRGQSEPDWQAYVNIDPSGDATYHAALLARAGDARIQIRLNKKWQGPMINLVRGVRRSNAKPEDLIVVLDGDDRFATPDALRIIHDTYRLYDCWLTYGSWLSDLGDAQGRWPAYPEDLTDFRGYRWLGTGVRTWRRWLWDLIDDTDFRDTSGKYLRVTEDQAVMLPMLEMSGPRARHIPDVLMVYTRSSRHAVVYTRREEMLANEVYVRTLPPYSRLIEKPDSLSAVRSLRLKRRSQVQAAKAGAVESSIV
jgi:glycosyltransferase involved in cell wall biosynthesis